jgi:hypothetical protein
LCLQGCESSLYFGKIQKLVDYGEQALTGAMHRRCKCPLLRIQFAIEQQFSQPQDAGQRSAKFMAYVGQKSSFCLLRRLCLEAGFHQHGLRLLLCRVVHHRPHHSDCHCVLVPNDEPPVKEGLVFAVKAAESVLALPRRLVWVADRLGQGVSNSVSVSGVQMSLPPHVVDQGKVLKPQDLLDSAAPQSRVGD